jgi:DNA polymerase-1
MSTADFPHRPGVSDDFLTKAGVTVLPNPERLHIPYHDIAGKPTGHFRDRFKSPVTGTDGKEQRYSQPFESGMHAYLPPFRFTKGEDLYVTEGEFKALSLCESGYNAVGLPGLFCYCDGAILPGLAQAVDLIAPPAIYFTGDADTLLNLHFYRSAQFMSDAFREIPVRLIQLPFGGGEKTGIDDKRGSLDAGSFSLWLYEASGKSLAVTKGQPFLQAATQRLKEVAQVFDGHTHNGRLIKVAVEAHKSNLPKWSIEPFLAAVQKCTRMNQAVFKGAVQEVLEAETEKEDKAHAWMHDPEPWPHPVDPTEVFHGLVALIRRVMHVQSDDDFYKATLMIFMSYFYDCFDYCALLRFRSADKRMGKSTFLALVRKLARKAFPGVDLTKATLYRLRETYECSLALDEVEDMDDEMRGLICASVNREDLVPRCSSNPEANNKVEFFNPYGWTALASIKPLHATVEDRSIMIFLIRRPYQVRLEKMRNVNPGEFHSLTQKLMRVHQDGEESVRACRYEVPDQISDRQGDKWIGPLRIAKTLFTPELFQECLAVAERDSKESEDSTDNLLWIVLHHIREARKCGIFTENGRALLKDLTAHLNKDKQAPWADDKHGPNYGITEGKLSRLFRTQLQIRSAHGKTGAFYTFDQFERHLVSVLGPEDPDSETPKPDSSQEMPKQPSPPSPRHLEPLNTLGDAVGDGSVISTVTTQVQQNKLLTNDGDAMTVVTAFLSTSDEVPSSVTVPPYTYVTDEEKLVTVLRDLQQPGAVALDIETYYPDAKVTKAGKRMKVAVSTVTDRYQSKIRLLQLYCDGSNTVWLLDLMALDSESVLFQMLRETLAAKDIIGHNITGFDLPWVWEHLRINASHIKDTMTAHRLLFGGLQPADAPADLGSVFKRTIQLDLPKDQGSSDWGTETLTEEQLVYAAHDVFHLHDVLRAQEAEMAKAKLDTAWKLEKRLAPIVVGMTNGGFGFNLDGVNEAKADLELRLADARHRALAWFGSPELNLNSNIQLLAAFQTKGRHLTSTSEEALKADGSEGALLLLEYRNIRDRELKFLTGLSEATRADGRIHAVFNSVGTKTGRFSCKDPNLQNVPRLSKGRFPIRSLFQAGPGRKLVIADFAQMELVAAAVLAPEPKMLAAFQAGEDLHCRTASILLGRTVTKDDKANRSLAKAVNFGLLYGQTAPGLKTYAKNSYGVTMTDEESVQFRETFFNEYQGLAAWHERARADANNPEVTEVRTHRVGRRQHLTGVEHWWSRFTSLLNTPIQGTCAEVTKLGLLDIGEKLTGRAQLVSCVHDEIIVECAEYDADAVLAEVQAIMETRSAQVFNGQKIGVEAHVADNWAGVKTPTYTGTRSTEDATQIELVFAA